MPEKRTKFIFVTGGVVSSLGKGIAAASLGLLLKLRGFKVTVLKLDPYLNVDPGTMSPFQHGEVFVTDDGAETDLDLGHYERFLDIVTGQKNNATSGQVYSTVIEKERRGDYLGKTVQVIPHLTDEIKNRINEVAEEDVDIVLAEVGGTVGDIEGLPFLEAIRQFRLDNPIGDVINIHLTLLPYIKASGEMKTKPTQHSVQKLREIGIQPDILICRTESFMSEEARQKIGLFCNVRTEAVIEAIDAKTIYKVPLNLEAQNLSDIVTQLLQLDVPAPDLKKWQGFVDTILKPEKEVKIAIAGKYVDLRDSYKSIMEAFIHAGYENNAKVILEWVDTEELDVDGAEKHLKGVSGLLIPGGFGERGMPGKIKSVQYARENKIPFFGICLGLQTAIIEFARSVCGLAEANSREFRDSGFIPVVDYMYGQSADKDKGGTMRLGAYPCVIKEGTLAHQVYGETHISERHRHRLEVNNDYLYILEKEGMVFCGKSPDGSLVEMIELPDHPWFLGVQFHPEFKSRALKAHPLFASFVKASLEYQDKHKK